MIEPEETPPFSPSSEELDPAFDLAEVELQQELRRMFDVDTQKYLQTYFDLVSRLQASSWIADIQALYRAIHTIKGGSVTVGADAILDVATALEDLLSDLRYLKPAPPLEDGQLSQLLLEAGELLAGTIAIRAVGEDAKRLVQPTVQRVQTLRKTIQGRYLPDWTERQQIHQEFAEQGFDLVVLSLEMALEQLSDQAIVPKSAITVAEQTVDQLQQIGRDLQLSSGWFELLQTGRDLLLHPDTEAWRSQWPQLFRTLKVCAQQGGKTVPVSSINQGSHAALVDDSKGDASTSEVWLDQSSSDDALSDDLTAAVAFLDDVDLTETLPEPTEAHQIVDDLDPVPLADDLDPALLLDVLTASRALDQVTREPEPPAKQTSEDQESPLVPVPLERLDQSAQYVVETLLMARATQGDYQTLQQQLVKLTALAEEGVQYISQLRQIQDNYALLDNLNGEIREPGQGPVPERYRQGYTTINRLLETSLRLSELGAEAEKSSQQMEANLQQLDRNLLQLQGTVEESRLVPFQNLCFRARAILRDLITRYGKPAQLVVEGEQIQLDIGTVRALEPALLHLIRNAYDHGLEPPQTRLAHLKSRQGTITLALQRRGNRFYLDVSDDGQGIDAQAVENQAEVLGLPLTQIQGSADLLTVIAQPGFSSQAQVTEISGRGIGMDVVSAQISRLGGQLSLETAPGSGTTFHLQFPVPHLLVPCVLFKVGDRTFAIPTEDIATTTLFSTLTATPVEDTGYPYAWTIQTDAGDVPGFDLLTYWQPRSRARTLEETASCAYIQSRTSPQGVWVFADELLGQSDLLINPVPSPLIAPDGLMGMSLGTDGGLIPVLDVKTLTDRILNTPSMVADSISTGLLDRGLEPTDGQALTVLIVDDAALMRRRVEVSLSAYGYLTHSCADGLEAWQWLQTHSQPALVITDIEMPNMDGFTLIDRCRRSGLSVPILVVSSRLSEEWGNEARRLGATDYLTKGFSTPQLMAKVDAILGS